MGIRIGSYLNQYIKSFGSFEIGYTRLAHLWNRDCPYIHSFWPRMKLVQFLGSVIAQIDEDNYKRCRGTLGWRGK